MSSNKFNSIQFIVTGGPVRNIERLICDIKGLLTESEVCTGKYLPEVFYRPSDEGARSVRINRRQILSRTDRAKRGY